MKKTIFSALLTAVTSTSVWAEPASWSAGIHAVIHPSVASATGGSWYAYTVTGGMVLHHADTDYSLSIHCTGLDRMGDGGLSGNGACEWTDADGGVLYVELATSDKGNRYRVSGGSGRWAGASGELTSVFGFLPGPSDAFVLATETGAGAIELQP